MKIYETAIDLLLTLACPSIQYRIRKELFGQSPSLPEMTVLQNQILQDEAVKEIIASQQPDGWLGWAFHGYNSMESGIRLLCEKGIEADQPLLSQALSALEKHKERLSRGIGKVGKALDDLGFGGAETIRAYLFAHAGIEDIPLVKNQVRQAFDAFKFAANTALLEDIHEPYKDKLVFREGVRFPSIYHLRLLAMTFGWRTPANRRMIKKSIGRLVQLSPIPDMHVKYKSQLIAPASFGMDHFTRDMTGLKDAEWMLWFHRMELLSRLGVVNQIPELKQQVRQLENLLQEDDGIFTKKLNHVYFKKWGAYTGLMLEKDWRTPQRRINDLTFRSVLILHHAGK